MNTGKILKAETSSFTKFWNNFLDSQFQDVKIEKDSMDSNWFLLSDVGLTGYSGGDIDYDMVKQSVESKISLFIAILTKRKYFFLH